MTWPRACVAVLNFPLAWSLFHPLLMLSIYTLVFGYIFHARWGNEVNSTADFAIVLFAGLIVFGIFSEAINRIAGVDHA